MLLYLIVSLVCSASLFARDGLVIRDIIVVGTSRTSEGVIRSQLPFREGDLWQDEYEQWAVRRLTALDIFAYEPLRITVEPVSESECRVMVRLADPSILYKDPAEFSIMTGMRLSSSQAYLTAYNPFGTGQNLNLNIVWGHNYSYGGYLSSSLGPGMASLSGRYYRGDYTFTNTAYESSGWSIEGSYRYWWNASLRQAARLQFHTYELNGEHSSRIIPELGLLIDNLFTGSLTASAGFSLEGESSFWRIQGALSGQAGPLIGLTRAGYTSTSTPENLRFAVGGYSLLPLRGEDLQYLSRSYLIGTGEYHFSLNEMLVPIVFTDCGWLWTDSPAPGIHELLFNLGVGFAVYTPIGLPVRLDFAVNPITYTWGWKLGFGHSYVPLY